MKREEFDLIFDTLVDKSRGTLVAKAREYCPSPDRLHNFKVQASLTGETPLETCFGNMTKHIVSVADMVREEGRDNTMFPMAQWDEKLGDMLNYCFLLYACVCERHGVNVDTGAGCTNRLDEALLRG